MRILIATIACFVFIGNAFAQETFKVMFYNVLNYPLQAPASRIDNLEIIIEDYQPDIFMICELNNEQGANDILNTIQNVNPNYARAAFVLNTSDNNMGNQNDLQNMIYFDTTKFSLEGQTEVTTIFRDFNHYTLKLNTINQDTNPIILNAFVTHLKSSSGIDNQQFRLQMVTDFVNYLDTLANDSFVLLGGDLNLYTASEDAFELLISDANNSDRIIFVDPADRIGSWHNNTSYLDVFTQSTRTQTGLGGATGGFDDRFDFILTSENMQSNADLHFVADSYKVYGNNNNSNCYNQEILSEDCSGENYDQTLRNALYLMSDHLPVTLELETNQSLDLAEFDITSAFSIDGNTIVSDWLNINIRPSKLNSKNVSIYNAFGQKVSSHATVNLNHLKINVSKMTSGIYYVVATNRMVKPLKFIKN